jgi:hypothetical protein
MGENTKSDGGAQVIEHIPSNYEALSSNPSVTKKERKYERRAVLISMGEMCQWGWVIEEGRRRYSFRLNSEGQVFVVTANKRKGERAEQKRIWMRVQNYSTQIYRNNMRDE